MTKRFIYPIVILIGLLITPHFGESWDELKFYKYADTALSAYMTWPTQGTVQTFGNTYDNYGPAYVMLVTIAAKPFQLFFRESDVRHYLYFLTFLAGIWAFHQLAKRWLDDRAALFSTLLFATQPLFIGHAFISPKDIPFLSFFLLSLLFGLRLFDSRLPILPISLDLRSKRILLVLSALWLVTVFSSYLLTDTFHSLITSLVQSAKSGQANVISFIASDLSKVDANIYVQRYFTLFVRARAIFTFLFTGLLIYQFQRHRLLSFIFNPSLLLAAILLGLTTSIRILGPLAALFIIYHAFRRHGKQAMLPLAVYSVIALIAFYLTWPYLWLDPTDHTIESIKVMSQYPWRGQVLFNGAEYSSTNLPYSYLPVLLSIQLTEPVWALFFIGILTAVYSKKNELLVITLFWFVLPLVYFIGARAALYDNFRQIFFILPPVFICAGLIFEKIKKARLQLVLMTISLLPGLWGTVHLHPYEYIYYNSFIGGVKGAFRDYELDYWGTSYREAANWLNENAAPDSKVWVEGPAHLLDMYLRDDIDLYSTYETERADHYDYIVATSRYNLDLKSHSDARIVHIIERDGAVLTVIKQ
jgi:4-amino-4-deoxy-L-arabinose transferase-like glycosyltransferase